MKITPEGATEKRPKKEKMRLNKKHKDILYNRIIESLEGQIPDPWEKKLFKSMVNNTRIRPVEEIGGKPGWEVRGQNISKVAIGPRGRRYVGPVEIYVPKETLARLRHLKSKDDSLRQAAEEALHTVSHEFAHDYFKAINYEARLTRFLRDNPQVASRQLSEFLGKTGKFDGVAAKKRAEELVKNDPLYWANYLAHTTHEAGADIMAAEAVSRVAQKRHATPRDLERMTAFRPFTVREVAMRKVGKGSLGKKKPKKPTIFEKLSRRLERGSWEFMNRVGQFDTALHPKKAMEENRMREGRMAQQHMSGGRWGRRRAA